MPEKRDSLIQAGEKLFVKHGVRRVTVAEICNEAGVNEQVFFRHFRDGADLAHRIVSTWVSDATKRFEAIERAATPFTEKLELIHRLGADLTARPGPMFVEDIIRLNIDMSQITTRTIRFLENAQKRGEVRKDIQPEVLHAALSSLARLQQDAVIRHLYREPGLLTRDLFNLYFEGVLEPKTR